MSKRKSSPKEASEGLWVFAFLFYKFFNLKGMLDNEGPG